MAILGRESEADRRRAEAWRDWLLRQHPLAIAAFVLGALSLTHAGTLIIDGVAAIVLGAMALAKLAWSSGAPLQQTSPVPPRDRGHGLAWAGIILAAVSLVIGVYLYTLTSAATGPTTVPAATR